MGGCVVGTEDRPKPNYDRIPLLVQQIQLTCAQQQMKRERLLYEQDMTLVEAFHKEPASRGLSIEKAMINRTVYFRNLTQIYLLVETECKIILERKAAIRANMAVVEASLQVLVYAASILKEPLMFQLQDRLRAYPEFRFPTDEQVRHELVRFHKETDQVTVEMENSYLLEFCGKYNFEMAKICEIGHKYGYSAGRQTMIK